MINISEIYSDCLSPSEMASTGNTFWQLPTSPLTTLRFCFDLFVCQGNIITSQHICATFLFSLTPLNIIPLCFFQRAYWDNQEGSHISRGRHPKDFWTCPMERGCAEPLIKPHLFLTNMPRPSCAASLAQHGVCTCPSAQSTAQTHFRDLQLPSL